MRLKDKVIMITGAARGLGKHYCLTMAQHGASILAMDISEQVYGVAAQVKSGGGTALAFQGDVSDEKFIKESIDEALRCFGRIDVLINNAAVYYGLRRSPFYEIDSEEWDYVMKVNLKAPWLCAKAVYPYMRRQGGGKIINIASEVFYIGFFSAHYVASKGGVIGLTRVLARDLGDYNICVNAVAPGFTDTEASRSVFPLLEKYDVNANCIKRIGSPDDLVGIIMFLASDESNYITGQTFLVDGGRVMI